ncbi:hypothetical protein BFP97_15805 [Roseivirga sp. 4D4]|uniref:DUF4345 domain-containing protein n=1 Tax=Roseivirga sp. 4D4 TaxID=1889784 RepID=UPI00085336FE|nr:DUF4345 domain-containing protein [Roseivirga sp. 4D4]OEK02898.1 hypothetical protein BFP97_15805 [Roseivirga sp. 4D4]
MKLIKTVTSGFIIFVSLIFLTVGVGAITAPEMVMSYLKVEALDDSALNSIRSIYGGLNLAFAIFLAYGAINMRKSALGLIILYMSGFLFGRIYSFLLNGLNSGFVLNWTFLEAALLIVSFVLLRALVKASREERRIARIGGWN